ncbi:Concanavalin A-like lectin/glucanases superfamily protein [Nonomuraea solani]|uniref:Concanavalin A-like lectin/glucanases superfamily protein n=1 Tax=Nonomuraea solani TaxID=1144553 RepID=A0A1H6EWJ3_9ACTN|nr:Concanavalin A-like lectin/glucanases superfamily protein [Nonomuraea solani]
MATPASADADLVAAYGMEEGSGTTVHDLSGNGNDGTVANPQWVDGKYGKGLRVGKLDQILTVPDAPSLRTADGLTVEAWIKADGHCPILAAKDDSYRIGGTWGIRTGGQNHDGESIGGFTGDWIHLALVYDGSTLRYVLDGWAVEALPVTGAVDYDSGPLKIGRSCPDATVDEVRVYRRGLADEEIRQDMLKAVVVDERPMAPVVSADLGTGTIQLSWPAATDDHGISAYEIHEVGAPEDTVDAYTLVATVTGLTWNPGCVHRNSIHQYRVVALDTLRQPSSPSEMVGGQVTNPDCPPTAPTVTVSPHEGWAGVRLNGAYDERGITEVQLHRSTTPAFTPSAATLVARVAETTTELTDHVPARATYYYATLAVDTTGNVSTPSAVVSALIEGPPDLQATLVGAYGLNEGTGTTLGDSSGQGHTGTATNPSWVSGKYGTALAFGYAATANVPNLPPRGKVTLSAWVKPKTNARPLEALSRNGFMLYAADWPNDTPSAGLGSGHFVVAPQVLPVDTWTHLAATHDGREIRLYVNGEPVGYAGNTDQFSGIPGQLIIGQGHPHGTLHGMVIDEVRTYDAALTPEQIKSIMTAPIG